MNKSLLTNQLTALFGLIAQFRTWVADTVKTIPGWDRVEAAADRVTYPLRWAAGAALRRVPALRKVEWLLETEQLKNYPPVMLAVALLFVAYRGLRTTSLGHIGTDLSIYPLLSAISGFNPFLGGFSAVCYGAGDLVQKFFVNDMYGTPTGMVSHYVSLDFWGGMLGYAFAYSALISMGVFPGAASRVARHAVRGALRRMFFRQRAASADGATPVGGDETWRLFERRRPDGTLEWRSSAETPGPEWISRSQPMDREEAAATAEGLSRGEMELPDTALIYAPGRYPVAPSNVTGLFNRSDNPPEKAREVIEVFNRSAPAAPATGGSPVAPNFKDPRTQEALGRLGDQGLLNDPDAWRTWRSPAGEPLGWRERQILGHLRGKRLLRPDNEAVINQLRGGGSAPDVPGYGPPGARSSFDAPDGGPSYPLPELAAGGAAMAAATFGVMTASPAMEFLAFYLRPNPDVGCFQLEAEKYLIGRRVPVAAQGATGGIIADLLGRPTPGGGGGQPPPTGSDPGTGPSGGAGQRSPIDRVNAIDPQLLLGNPKLQEEYRDLLDRYKDTGKIDEKALSDFERKVGQATDERRQNWDKESQAAVDRSNKQMADRDAALEADAQRRRQQEQQLQDTLGRVAKGDLNSAAGLDIANNPDVYNPDGSIDQAKLDQFINRVTQAKRDLATQQRDNAQAVANTSGRVSDAWTAAEWAAKQARDRSANAVGAILTGGVGVVAGGGLAGAVAAGTAGTYFGAATGAIRAASDAGSLDRDVLLGGAAGGALGGAIGGVVGGVIGGAAGFLPTNAITTAIAQNPTVTGAVLGGLGAAATGGNIIEGAVDGAIGGKLGGATGRTLGKPGGGWKKPIDWKTGPLGASAPPPDLVEGDPWAGKATPPPPVGPGSNKGPRVGLSDPTDPWMKPPERGGGPKPGPTMVKGQDIDPPPTSQQPWKKRWGNDPETGKQTDAGIPPDVDPDGDPYFPDKVRGKYLPKDYEGPGATPGKKYPGGTGKDDGTLEPYTTPDQKAAAAAAREKEIARLAQQDDKDLAKQLTEADMLAQDKKQADLIRDAIKRKAGVTKPPVEPEPPPDPAIRQAELDKLKNLSRKELEARELTAQIEGDKKQADLMREAINRNKEPAQPPKIPSRDATVKDLSNLDPDDLAASRDAARARSDDATALSDAAKARGDAAAAAREAARARDLKAQAKLYDDAMAQQAADDLKAQARAPRPEPSVDDLAKKYTLEELKMRERLFRGDGDEATANKMAEAAKKKSSYGAEEDARLEAVMEQRRQANAAARAAKEADANMTPAQRAQKAAAAADQEQAARLADGQKRKADLDRLMEEMKAAQGKGSGGAPPPVDQDAATNPNLPRPGSSRPPTPPAEADFDAKTNPNLSRPGTQRPDAPATPPVVDEGAVTNPNLSRPGTARPPATPPDVDQGATTNPNLSRPGTSRPPAPDEPDLGAKTDPNLSRPATERPSVGERPTVEAPPDRPEVRMPWEEPGQPARDVVPDAPPPRPDVPEPLPGQLKPEDLPPPGEPFTSEQRGNLRTDYSKDQLVAARNEARASGNHGQANTIEDVLADRGYRAPVDPNDIAPPPPGELPNFTQVENLAKNYSTKQLQEMWADANSAGNNNLRLLLENAINQKKVL